MSAEAKPRTKRSWTRIVAALQTDEGEVTFTFWPTPEGLHRRRKGSPNVRTLTWAEIQKAMSGERFKFDHEGRHYELWHAEDGLHVLRCGHEEHVVKWPQFVEFVDGQKLLPI